MRNSQTKPIKIIEKNEKETNKNNWEKEKKANKNNWEKWKKKIKIIEKKENEANRNKLRKRKPIETIEKRNRRNYFFLFPIILYKMRNVSTFFENEKQGTLSNTSVS